ncbi:hypothetical protein EVAR_79500_1 [Eumeta japonica]|uniref:Uncharacterized protein n=1 Tax=Eumeta variegata TaxID=151549 RepID=A0A4C1UDR4_EUMVA|nr:hypothetical protein EVAR_79500_1 [Eumeta japonica]
MLNINVIEEFQARLLSFYTLRSFHALLLIAPLQAFHAMLNINVIEGFQARLLSILSAVFPRIVGLIAPLQAFHAMLNINVIEEFPGSLKLSILLRPFHALLG